MESKCISNALSALIFLKKVADCNNSIDGRNFQSHSSRLCGLDFDVIAILVTSGGMTLEAG